MQERKKRVTMRACISRCSLYRRFLKHLPPVTLALIAGFMIFGLGFIFFSEKIHRLQPPEPLQAADGIIVLTGGRARLETGLKLLENGKGKRLLISGVNPVAGRHILMRVMHADPHLFECCVDLGQEAVNTIGNAEESARWVKKNGYHTVFVVTNGYHMPRSLNELRRKMPDTVLIPYPAGKMIREGDSPFQSFEHLRIIMIEYIKFIGVAIRNFFV